MIFLQNAFLRYLLLSSVVWCSSADDELGEAASLFSGPVEVAVLDSRVVWPESPIYSESGDFLLFSDVKWEDPDTGFKCGMLWKYDVATEQLNELLKCSGLVGPPGPDAVDGLPADVARLAEGGSNGLSWGWEDGTLLMNQHGWKRMVQLRLDDIDEATASIDPDLVTIVADTYDGTNLNSPNDIDLADDGLLYFTDPPFGLQYKDVDDAFGYSFDLITQDAPAVYSLNEPGAEPLRLLEFDVPEAFSDRYGPNGLGVNDANGDLAVVITHWNNPRTIIYPRNEDGTISKAPKKVLLHEYRVGGGNADQGWPALSDGLTFDTDLGALFINGPGGVYIYDAEDYEASGFIRTDDLCPNNVVGGGYLWISCFTKGIHRVPLAKPAKPALIGDGSLIDTLTSMSGSDGVDEDSTDFDLLLHFLEVAGLTDVLAEASDVTLFAPDDQAFCELSQIFGFNSTLGFTSCADEEAQIIFWEQAISTFPVEEEGQDGIVEGWKYILSYHVAQGAMNRKDLLGAGTITMMGGHEVTVRKGRGDRVVLVPGWTPPRPLPRVKTMQKNIKVNTNFIQVINFPLTPPAPAWAPDAW